jgi:hypothetical protein
LKLSQIFEKKPKKPGKQPGRWLPAERAEFGGRKGAGQAPAGVN